jgi:hypothetical protein
MQTDITAVKSRYLTAGAAVARLFQKDGMRLARLPIRTVAPTLERIAEDHHAPALRVILDLLESS